MWHIYDNILDVYHFYITDNTLQSPNYMLSAFLTKNTSKCFFEVFYLFI